MLLVVLSYYKHYHITQLAVKQAIAHIPNIDKVAIIWDDTHATKPINPIYTPLDHPNLGCYWWSHLSNIVVEGGDGWFNQQVVKLNVDQIVDDQEFIIMDGDLILNQDIDPKNIMYATQVPQTHRKYNHLNKMLGTYYGDFSSCPIMYVHAAWLRNLRTVIKLNSSKEIYDMIAEHTPQVNDWDLISGYALNVLRLPKRIEPFQYTMVSNVTLVEKYNNFDNFVLFGDDLVDQDFWRSNGIHVDNSLYDAKL